MDKDSILSVVKSFFDGMTSEQWNLLKSGKPDEATITVLGEQLLQIVFGLTQSILKGLESSAEPVSKESVLCTLGNRLPVAFSQALDDPEEVSDVSSERLTQLTAHEIAECVNSVLSTGVDSAKSTIPRVTSPNRLQAADSNFLSRRVKPEVQLIITLPETNLSRASISRTRPHEGRLLICPRPRTVSGCGHVPADTLHKATPLKCA
ncbi:unnamed protein product [Pleuronectes platessa]|uniref:Uncharacterized protein n=1 Tax=Pleuronectes platessa TaxID=8262 RepID=A0A9N7VTY7_PLEPL|nr:unnamed protein product [Pleuronectes platessa]